MHIQGDSKREGAGGLPWAGKDGVTTPQRAHLTFADPCKWYAFAAQVFHVQRELIGGSPIKLEGFENKSMNLLARGTSEVRMIAYRRIHKLCVTSSTFNPAVVLNAC